MVSQEWIMWVHQIRSRIVSCLCCFFRWIFFYFWVLLVCALNSRMIFSEDWDFVTCNLFVSFRFACFSPPHFIYVSILVLKRCISGLPTTECPFIPKRLIQQYQSRHTRSILLDDTDDTDELGAVRARRRANVSDLIALSQLGIEPPAQCEERRKLGQQILIEKGHQVDSMLSRFVGNFIMHFSNLTESQEVSRATVRMGICTRSHSVHFSPLSPFGEFGKWFWVAVSLGSRSHQLPCLCCVASFCASVWWKLIMPFCHECVSSMYVCVCERPVTNSPKWNEPNHNVMHSQSSKATKFFETNKPICDLFLPPI